MRTLKIKSNLYKKTIEYFVLEENTGEEQQIKNKSLTSEKYTKCYLPYKFDNVLQKLQEIYFNDTTFTIFFEGTQIEYNELSEILRLYNSENTSVSFELIKPEQFLNSGEEVLNEIKNKFEYLEQSVRNSTTSNNDPEINEKISKLKQIYDKSIIPVCFVGNYSSGKSTFINSIIGYEYLPGSDNSTTHAIYSIEKSTSQNQGRISFKHNSIDTSITYTSTDINIKPESFSDSDLFKKISKELSDIKEKTLEKQIRESIKVFNDVRVKEPDIISSMINIKVPFNTFVLDDIDSSYIFFDIPGENTALNDEDYNTFEKAMRDFTNGLIIFLSVNDSKVSKDNCTLIDKVKNIQEFDSRFSFIVINKADMADFVTEGKDLKEVQESEDNLEVMNRCSTDKLFFGSAHMSIFAKKGSFLYKGYTFSDSMYQETKISKYNIAPPLQYKQMQNWIINTTDFPGVHNPKLYVNSGIFTVEKEIAEFAKKYSLYNKCFQSKKFFDIIIDLTQKNITNKTKEKKETLEDYNEKLNKKEKNVVKDIETCCEEYKKTFDCNNISQSIITNEKYELNTEGLNQTEKHAKQNDEFYNAKLNKHEYAKQETQDTIKSASENVSKSKHKIKEIGKGVKNIAQTFAKELKTDLTIKDRIDHNKKVMDEMYKYVTEQWNSNVEIISEDCIYEIKENCKCKVKELRSQLTDIVKKDVTLDKDVSEELQKYIQSVVFETISEKGEDIIPKKTITRSFFSIIDLSIDKHKAIKAYTDTMRTAVTKFCDKKIKTQKESFDEWVDTVNKTLSDKILELHPDLMDLKNKLEKVKQEIQELNKTKQIIEQSQKEITELMEL